MSRHKLAAAFNDEFGTNKTVCAIKSLCSKHKWPSEIQTGREYIRTSTRFYTEEQLDFVREKRTLSCNDLALAFNKKFGTKKTKGQISAIRKHYGCSTGRTGRFEKGNKPYNTGTKGVCEPNSGSFKKGHRPITSKPIGSERIDTQYGYLLVKIAEPNVWQSKHRVVWEAANGPIKQGEVLTFKDGNVLNISLENLEKITRLELVWLNKNGYAETPPELKSTLRALAKVNVKVFNLNQKTRRNS
jgi:hypothetical protein